MNKEAFTIKDEKLSITGKVSEDNLKLFVDVKKLTGDPITEEMVIALLSQKISKEIIHQGVIADIVETLNKGKEANERRVVKGTLAQDGHDGKVVFMVRKFTGVAEPGSTYFDLSLFDNVKPGDVVARIYAPKNGLEGFDALGKKIPAKPGKPVKVTFDKTIEQRPGEAESGYEILVAQAEGYLSEDTGKLLIKDELSIAGSIDFHIGNLNFLGKIKVSADVMPKFRVEAKSDVEVYGAVRGENRIISREGSVTVKGFAFGGKDSSIFAGRDIDLSVAQEITAEAIGNIFLQKEAQSCIFRAGKSVLGPKAILSGGVHFAVVGIEVQSLGNQSGALTHIHLCSSVETTTDYLKLSSELESHEKAEQLIEMHLGPFAKNSSRIQLLKSPHREKMEALLKKYNQVVESKKILIEKKKVMLQSGVTNDTPRVSVQKKIYPGVHIHAGEEIFSIQEEISKPISIEFSNSEKKFTTTEFKALVS